MFSNFKIFNFLQKWHYVQINDILTKGKSLIIFFVHQTFDFYTP